MRNRTLPAVTLELLFLAAGCSPAWAQNNIAQHLVISEVRINGTGSAETDEFVEIYNPTSKPVNLKGWSVLTQNSSAGNRFTVDLTGLILGPGKFLLMGGSAAAPGIVPDLWVSNFSLTNGGGSIELRDSNHVVVDAVGWGNNPLMFEGTPFPTAGADGHSFERKASTTSTAASLAAGGTEATQGNGQDTDNNNADFVEQDHPNPQDVLSLAEMPPGGFAAVKQASGSVPLNFELKQNYPNPFNPTTTIEYSIPINQYVSLTIYDVLGREVATLVSGYQSAGEYKLHFDGSDLASGIYFYRLEKTDYSEMRKMVLVR